MISPLLHPARPLLPTTAELNAAATEFWFIAIKTSVLIRRADLWRAKHLLDGTLKQRLLVLIEWHAPGQLWHRTRHLV